MELIKIENGLEVATQQLIDEALEIKYLEEKLKVKKDSLTLSLLEEMRDKGIKKIETPDVVISYIEESERETLDSKRFRTENPDLYDEYVKFTPVKASIRIKAK
jgi:hypothetical protein